MEAAEPSVEEAVPVVALEQVEEAAVVVVAEAVVEFLVQKVVFAQEQEEVEVAAPEVEVVELPVGVA